MPESFQLHLLQPSTSLGKRGLEILWCKSIQRLGPLRFPRSRAGRSGICSRCSRWACFPTHDFSPLLEPVLTEISLYVGRLIVNTKEEKDQRGREKEMTCKVRPNLKLVPGWATGWLVQATNGNFYGTTGWRGPNGRLPHRRAGSGHRRDPLRDSSRWRGQQRRYRLQPRCGTGPHSWKPCPLPPRWGSRQQSGDRSHRLNGRQL